MISKMLSLLVPHKGNLVSFTYSDSTVYLVGTLEDLEGEFFYLVTKSKSRATSYPSKEIADGIERWITSYIIPKGGRILFFGEERPRK